jgi:SNF2 family DNA or RNA helicase
MGKISDIFFSLREEDYLDLPPLIPRDHFIQLPRAAMKKYRELEEEMAIDVINRAGEKEVIEAVNNGVLTGKLLQLANGSLYLGDKYDEETDRKLPRESVKVHDEKLKVLESIMEEAMGQPVLVAYSFQFDKEAILKKFPYCRLFGESPNDMRDWNAGKIRMLLTHPASAGHGLNFQFGSNIAVWYGLTFSLELYRQFVKRLHRSGQEKDHVFLHRVIAKGTADETILPALTARGSTQDRISDAVRVRLMQAA